jgi:hypothetical protein
MSAFLGQMPSHTAGQVLTDTHVFWRGRWHRFAGAEDNPPAGDPPTPAPVTPPAAGQEPPKTFDAEYVAELRREAAANRKKAADAEARLKELDDAKLSETERLTKRTAELEAELERERTGRQEALIRAAVEREAHQQGAVKADVVYRLIDRSAIALDDSGEVKGADKAVAALLTAEPYLKANTAGTTAVPGTPRPNGQAPTREALINDKYEKLKASGAYSRLG